MILRGQKGLFPFLLPVQPPNSLVEIPLRTWCRRLADFVASADEDVFGEGADVVGLEQ